MAKEYLDKDGLAYFWTKIKSYIDSKISGGSVEHPAVTLASNWEWYGTTGRLEKVGKVVHINARFKPSKSQTLNATNVTVATISTEYAPPHDEAFLIQSSGSAIALCQITSAGRVTIGRLRNMASNNNAYLDTGTAYTWFPVHHTWIID